MYENKGVTTKVINKLQSHERGNIEFVSMLTIYLIDRGRLLYDSSRDLFWVRLPDDTYQVAVWMLMFEE